LGSFATWPFFNLLSGALPFSACQSDDVATLNRTHFLKYSKKGVFQNEPRKTKHLYRRIQSLSGQAGKRESIAQTAKDLGININTLHTWIGKYSRPTEHDKTVRTDEHLYDELTRLKKEVGRLTEKRDLLKKDSRG